MRRDAAGDDQAPQGKPLVVRSLPRPVDPASGNIAAIDGDGRPFCTTPRDQTIAESVSVLVVGNDPVEQRRNLGRGSGADIRSIADLATTAQTVGYPIHRLEQKQHGASFLAKPGSGHLPVPAPT